MIVVRGEEGLKIGDALEGTPAHSWFVVARVVDYLGTAVFFGGIGFIALLWPAGADEVRARAVLIVGWTAGLLGTVAAIGLEAAWASGGSVSDAFSWDMIEPILHTRFGEVWVAKALIWVLAAVVLGWLLHSGESAVRSLQWRLGALAVSAGLVRTVGMIGHVTETDRAGLAQAADFVHVAGISLWIGGLVMLLAAVLPRRRPAELAVVVPNYSRLAFGSVLAISAAGLVLGWQIVGSVDDLTSSAYGQLLIAKVLIFGVVLVAAKVSKQWVGRRLDFAVVLRGDGAAVRPFVYSVLAETALVVLVVTAAGFLVTANPGQ